MATTFDVLYLGTVPALDVNEGDNVSDNAGSIVGQTFGTVGDPLYDHVQTLSPGSTGYGSGVSGTAYDIDNTTSNDTFRIDGGPDQTMDAVAAYTATITYVDGTTATISANIFQDTDGRLYLAPKMTAGEDQTALEAKPIQSLTLDTLTNKNTILAADRVDSGFMEAVDGTAGDDTMGPGYTDGEGDQIDGTDGDADWIEAGAGNDSVVAGAGDDTIHGGAGDDTIEGGAGNDTIIYGDGSNTIYGGDGNDLIDDVQGNDESGHDYVDSGSGNDAIWTGWGNDTIVGGTGDDVMSGEEDADTFILEDDFGNDTIDGGSGVVLGGDSTDTIDASAVTTNLNVTYTGHQTGTLTDGTDTVSFNEVEDFVLGQGDDTLDASVDTVGKSYSGMGGNDSMSGTQGHDAIDGGTGADRLAGNDGADTILGGDGDDTIYAGSADTPGAAPHMVGYWTFDDYSTPEDDLAAADNDAVFMDGADVASASGEVTLDGAGDHVVIADDPAYDIDSYTMRIEFTLDTLSSRSGLISKDSSNFSATEFSIYVEPDGSVVIQSDYGTLVTAPGLVGTGTEHSVQVSYDNATGAVEFYVDDVLAGSSSAGGLSLAGNTNPWVLGATSSASTPGTADNTADHLDGTIDSFAVYDTALTPWEIKDPDGGADVIDGGAGDDAIHGDSGDDLLAGGDGSDTIHLYDHFGSDTIIGGEGGSDADMIDAGAVSIPLTVVYSSTEGGTISDGASTITFSEVELVETGSDADVIDATALSDGVRIVSGFGDDTVYGGAGADTISSGNGHDYMTGGAGDDSVNAGSGNDTIYGGDGQDTIWASFGDDLITGDAGDDFLYGGYGADTIFGGTGDDTIGVGRGDGDVAYGEDGSDYFFFDDDMGDATIYGGTGGTDVDLIEFDSLVGDGIGVTWTTDENGTASEPDGTLVFHEIEGAIGSGQADTIDASATSSGKILDGGAGGDDTITGGAGADTITGGSGADLLSGGGGDDLFIFANGFGSDTISGGDTGETGGDTLDFTAVTVPLTVVFSGTDAGTVSDGTDTISFTGIENLVFGAGADFVSAGGDTDGMSVETGDGADTVWGSAGGDTVIGGAGNDEIFGDDGADSIIGGDGADDLGGDAGDDTIDGGAGDDWIQGNEGANQLSGSGGDDTFEVFTTQAGNDTIDGGETGETEGDRIIFTGPDGTHVTLTGDEAGSYTAGLASGSFTNIETIDLTDHDDSFDAGAATTARTIDGGAGDDTLTGGTGDDTITGGAGDDVLRLEDAFGTDTFSGGETDEVDGDSIDASAITAGGVSVAWTDATTGTLALNANGLTFSEIESLTLTQFADTFDASLSGAAVEVDGGAGADTLTGSAGDDTLTGGAGDDQFHGGDGADLISGGAGDDAFYLAEGFGNDTISGGETGETLGDTIYLTGMASDLTVTFTSVDAGTISDGTSTVYFTGIERVLTGEGNDTVDLTGDADGAYVFTDDGADVVISGAGDDTINTGNNGDEIYIDDASGTDTISAGNATDTIHFSDATGQGVTLTYTGTSEGAYAFNGTAASGSFTSVEVVEGTEYDDTFDATAADGGARVNARDGDDVFYGGAGDDTFNGGDGDDTFVLADGFGNDVFNGGGNAETDGDTLDASALSSGLTVTYTDGEDGTLSDGTNSLSFVETESVLLGDGADTVDGTAATEAIGLDSGAGDDSILGGAGADTLAGGQGADTIRAGAGDDSVSGGDGNDAIYGFEGSDTVDGGAGDDYINTRTSTGTGRPDTGLAFPDDPATAEDESALYSYAADADPDNDRDSVTGGAGHDTILTGDDDDTIHGGTGDDSIDAGYDDDVVWGDDGADTIEGNEGADVIDGGAGDDVIYGSLGPGNPGYATSGLFELDDAIDPEPGNNADTLSGGIGNDRIYGQDDDDVLDGGDGDDTLDGGIDDDTLTGGAGHDTFVMSDGGGVDVITDFDLADDDTDGATNDQLDLSGLTDADGQAVNIWDVVVSDTVGDGSGDAVLTFPNGETLTLTNVDPTMLDAQMMQAMGIPCLVAGTLIDTPEGGRRVEDLLPGDLVMTLAGTHEPVLWAGQRTFDAEALAARPDVAPIRLRAGALGNWRDLLVSPQHRIALSRGGVPKGFVPARWLAEDGDGRFRTTTGRRSVTYVHILLPRHAVIRAEGAWVESFFPGPEGLAALDIRARAELYQMFPRFARIRNFQDAKRIYGPLALRRIRRRDLARFLDPHRSEQGQGIAAE